MITKSKLQARADRLWSLAVRNDWANQCAVCGKRKCEAHHLISRRNAAVRYELRNGIALCRFDHQHNADLAPHVNPDGWICWLVEHHPAVMKWWTDNLHNPMFRTRNEEFYFDAIRGLREYVEESDYLRIIGKKLAAEIDGGNDL